MDRVVASIGNEAITQADVEAEIRFELFLEGKAPNDPPDPAKLAQARDRIIEQKLLTQEAAAEGESVPDEKDGGINGLEEIRRKFGNEDAYRAALRDLGIDDSQAAARLADQDRTLRMIDQRFRPAAQPEPANIEAYYHDVFVPEYSRRTASTAPPLQDVESNIREILVQQRIDQLLDAWLSELKSSHRVKVHEF